MDKNKIKKIYNGKIQNLVKLNKHYYNLNKPLVNDDEYDQLKEDILTLEKKYNFLDSKNTVMSPKMVADISNQKEVLNFESFILSGLVITPNTIRAVVKHTTPNPITILLTKCLDISIHNIPIPNNTTPVIEVI